MIEIEINEAVMSEQGRSSFVDIISPLKTAGFRISLDDFGAGSATLVHLRDLDIDCIKIDRSFVMRMESCDRSSKIIRSVVGLCSELRIESLAQGVETKSQRVALQLMGCEIGQGLLFGQPMSASDIPSFIAAISRPDKKVVTVIPRRIGATARSGEIGMRVVK